MSYLRDLLSIHYSTCVSYSAKQATAYKIGYEHLVLEGPCKPDCCDGYTLSESGTSCTRE